MAQRKEEVGVQVEAIAREDGLLCRATATDAGVSFDDRDFQTGPCQIGRKRESVVSGSDDDTIELFHSLLPTTPSTLLHEPTLDHGVAAFVAVDELRHAHVAGHSIYFKRHLVLAAFGHGYECRLDFKIRPIRQDYNKFSAVYPQNYPRATLEF